MFIPNIVYVAFVLSHRRGLEKAVKEDSIGMISDILANISTVTMTAELIKKSKLGKELIGVVSKYKTSSDPSEVLVSEKADEILNCFKKIVSESQESNKKGNDSFALFNLFPQFIATFTS